MIRSRYQQGVAVIEMAIVLPFLILLLLGAADFARLYNAKIKIDAASRAGVHYGSRLLANATDHAGMVAVAQTDAALVGMTASATDFCYCNGQPPAVVCASSCSPPDTQPQRYVEVVTGYTFHTTVSYPGIPSPVNLTATSRMRVQ